MKRLLIITTRESDELEGVVRGTREQVVGDRIDRVELREGDPDYAELIEKIFEAETVEVW